MLNILISSAGSQNATNVIKALRHSGRDFHIVACDCDRMSAGLYQADKRYLVPKNSDPSFIPAILEIVEGEQIDVVIPTYSTEFPVFAENADKFKGKLVVSSPAAYAISDNKLRWKRAVSKWGIDVPMTSPPGYPRIVKPITGSGSKHQFIVNNFEEFSKVKNETNFYEEYIEGQEWVVDGMSDLAGKMICAMPRKRLVAFAGGAKKAVTVDNPELVEKARLIVERLGLVGAWNVQCIEQDGRYYFIDVNNRFPSGGMGLAAAAGVNMPLMTIDLLRGNKIEPKLIYNLIMLRYDDEVIVSEQTAAETGHYQP